MMIIIGLTILVFYCFVLGVLYTFQEDYVYFPSNDVEQTPQNLGLMYEEVFLTTEDNVKLWAWWIPIPNARGTVLICHGNAGNISHRLEKIRIFNSLKFNCFIFDYRGYGKSQGKPSEVGTYKDVLAGWDFLMKKGISPAKILVMGRSLGGPIATYLASKQNPKALLLEATFSSLSELGQHHYPYFPVALIGRIRYPTQEYIQKISCPILIVHSKEDRLVPIQFGKKLFEIAKEPKDFLEITGDHNYGFSDNEEIYTQKLEEFLRRYF